MNEASQNNETVSESLPADMLQLHEAVQRLPEEMRQSVAPILQRVLDSTRRRRKILNLVQDALGQLRLDMKYLMFDLEATRRERDDFRDRLGEDES